MIGMDLPVPVLSIAGLAAILALLVPDPSAWLVTLGGPTYGVIALVFVITANLGTTLAGVYATAVGLRQVPGLAGARWGTLMRIALVPVALVSLVVPARFFANFGTFLAYIGVFFAPICAIQIVDFLILRRRRISIRAVFVGGQGTDDHYWGGFNPAAVLAMLGGVLTYLYLLNPASYASHAPYGHLTASLPTAAAAGAICASVTLAVVKPAGKGGYSRHAKTGLPGPGCPGSPRTPAGRLTAGPCTAPG